MTESKVGRNDPCPCGSGKKHKKCCEGKVVSKKFKAEVLSNTPVQPQITQETARVSNLFFRKEASPKPPEEPKNPVL